MENIQTAEEFFNQRFKNPHVPLHDRTKGEILYVAREFAKMHVKAALEAALEEVPYGGSDEVRYEDVKGILTCYPEDLIK